VKVFLAIHTTTADDWRTAWQTAQTTMPITLSALSSATKVIGFSEVQKHGALKVHDGQMNNPLAN